MSLKRPLKIFAAVLSSYVLGYLVLMRRDWPAHDETFRVAFRSACRFAPLPVTLKSSSGLTVVVGRVTLWNHVFYPLDFVYYKSRGLSPRPSPETDP
jgi:hypothetical protein